MPVRDRQISVRVQRDTDAWLERRAGGTSNKADFVRALIEREMARERQEALLAVFNEAAADVTESDRAERDALLGAFIVNDEPAPGRPRSKARGRRKGSR